MSNTSSRDISPDIEVQNAFSNIKPIEKSDCDVKIKSNGSPSVNEVLTSPKLFEFWHDGSRRSAFSPYTRPTTILTNLQRGNVKTESTAEIPELSIHQLAAQGQLFPEMKLKDVDEKDSNGLTPLIWACAYGQYPTVTMLIENGADLNVTGNHGENSLLLSSSNGHIDIVKLLIKKKMEINHVDEHGNSALMYAAFDNHANCVDELLKNGADFTISNLNSETAYSIAVSRGSKQVQAILEKQMLTMLEANF